jgi:hypothetical protein
MTSTHLDYASVDLSRASDDEIPKYVQDNDVPAPRSMNGEFLELDSKRGVARCRRHRHGLRGRSPSVSD